MSTEAVTAETDLPHGGTVAEFRREQGQAGHRAVTARNELFKAEFAGKDGPASKEAVDQYELLVYAGADAWSVVALLSWIDRKYGVEAAYQAAAIAQEIGINGDPWDESLIADVWAEIEPAPTPASGETA